MPLFCDPPTSCRYFRNCCIFSPSVRMWGTSIRNSMVAVIFLVSLYVLMYNFIVVKRHKARNSAMHASMFTVASTATITPDVADCNPGVPCKYPEIVDFRIIVLTFNRSKSLAKLLKTLEKLEGLGQDKAIIDIWVDRDRNQKVNHQVVQVAKAFNWLKGRVRTHVQKQQVGIYGQWIHTWRPPASGKEIAVILEDDLSVSPHMYRWLKAAHAAYDGRTDIGGYTLHCGKQIQARGGGWVTQPAGAPYLYKLFATWGFSPHPKIWTSFQDWFAIVRQDMNFRPYVNGLMLTDWYKSFEEKHDEDSMWEQWFIFFSEKSNLYYLYNNIQTMVNKTNGRGQCLVVNRMEIGLHYKKKGKDETHLLLKAWKDQYIKFPDSPILLEWDGKSKEKIIT